MKFKKIFVTVGTTEFDSLIRKISEDETNKILKDELGCEELKLQIGRGEKISFENYRGVKVDVFSLKESIADDIDEADLVISHAGAGTCIDVLSRGKPLIVVINNTLMHNHQMELAEQLSSDGYLFYTTIDKLLETLRTFDVTRLKKYEKGNVDKFIDYLDKAMGFV